MRYPVVLLFLLPVIIIETAYVQGRLRTNPRRTIVAVTVTNLVTTALGYPLAWALFKGINSGLQVGPYTRDVFNHLSWLPVWLAARLVPDWSGLGNAIWPILAVYVALLLPGFLISGLVKVLLMDSYDLLSYKGNTRPAIWAANRLSYLFLAAAGCVLMYMTYAGP